MNAKKKKNFVCSQCNKSFIDKAHLALNDGEMFGPGGEGFMRLNVGSPKAYIEAALEKLARAVEQYA